MVGNIKQRLTYNNINSTCYKALRECLSVKFLKPTTITERLLSFIFLGGKVGRENGNPNLVRKLMSAVTDESFLLTMLEKEISKIPEKPIDFKYSYVSSRDNTDKSRFWASNVDHPSDAIANANILVKMIALIDSIEYYKERFPDRDHLKADKLLNSYKLFVEHYGAELGANGKYNGSDAKRRYLTKYEILLMPLQQQTKKKRYNGGHNYV